MLSTCPECRTTFRISQAQLDAKRGLVRCGRCNAVFNAYDALLPELEAPPPEEQIEAASPAPAREADAHAGVAPAAEFAPAGPDKRPAESELAAQPQPEAEPQPLAEPGSQVATRPETAPAPQPESEPQPEPQPESEPQPEPARARRAAAGAATEARPPEVPPLRWILSEGAETPESILLSELPVRRSAPSLSLRPLAWLLLVLLLLLLPLQAAYFLRAELAAWLPQTRPYLEAACEPIGCAVALPRDRTALRVESSSLETDPENPANAHLRVAFSNRAGQTVAWPHIVLILTDLRDSPVAQRVFAPKDYLPARDASRPGLEAGGEYEAGLELDLNGLVAAGYRVVLDYP